MKIRQAYKGQIIESMVFAVRGGGWTTHFCLEKHNHVEVLVTRFETGQIFRTAKAALQAGLHYGAMKIESGYSPVAGY